MLRCSWALPRWPFWPRRSAAQSRSATDSHGTPGACPFPVRWAARPRPNTRTGYLAARGLRTAAPCRTRPRIVSPDALGARGPASSRVASRGSRDGDCGDRADACAAEGGRPCRTGRSRSKTRARSPRSSMARKFPSTSSPADTRPRFASRSTRLTARDGFGSSGASVAQHRTATGASISLAINPVATARVEIDAHPSGYVEELSSARGADPCPSAYRNRRPARSPRREARCAMVVPR